jgi:hypothetical protein
MSGNAAGGAIKCGACLHRRSRGPHCRSFARVAYPPHLPPLHRIPGGDILLAARSVLQTIPIDLLLHHGCISPAGVIPHDDSCHPTFLSLQKLFYKAVSTFLSNTLFYSHETVTPVVDGH